MDELFAHLAIVHLFSIKCPFDLVLIKLVTVSGNFPALLHRLDLLQRQRIALKAVEEWVLRVRVSFCKAGIQRTCTVAARICSRNAAIFSTRASNLFVTVNCGS
jgi:hypothetical protein